MEINQPLCSGRIELKEITTNLKYINSNLDKISSAIEMSDRINVDLQIAIEKLKLQMTIIATVSGMAIAGAIGLVFSFLH